MTPDINELLERMADDDATFTRDEVLTLVQHNTSIAVDQETSGLRIELSRLQAANAQYESDLLMEAKRIARERYNKEPMVLYKVVNEYEQD